MNFRQLEVLVSVIRHGSFSKAAKELFLTQPTVSSHTSSLEEELGLELVKRGSKAASATRAGTVLYEYANGLLRMRDNVLDSMKHYPTLLSSNLEIAASTVPSAYLLPGLITKFHEAYPGIRFSVRESNSQDVLSHLLANEVEIGFTGAELRNEKCHFEELASDQLVIVTPARGIYAELPEGEFPKDLLQSSSFILRASGSATQKEADAFLINMGISPQSLHVAAYMDSIEAIKQTVKNGLGIAILSETAVQDMEKRGELRVFRSENPFLFRKLYCVYRSDKPLSPAGELFLNFALGRELELD